MKKLSIFLVIAMLFTVCFSGCGVKGVPVTENNPEKQVAEETQPDEAENTPETPVEAEETPEDASAEEPVSKEEPKTASVDLTAVKNAIVSGAGVSDPLDVPTARLESLYGIDTSLVKQAASFVTIEGAFPDEIVMIEAVSEEAAEMIQVLLGIRLSEVKEQSKSYDPENYALAQQCTVGKKGAYVSMFLAPQHAKMKAIFDSYVK